MFDGGWDQLRQERLETLKQAGLVSVDLADLPTNFMVPDWASLSDDERLQATRDMEVYAAMVDYMDMSIGRLVEYLKKHDMYENTLIVFFSDNGANGAHASAYPGNSDGSYLASFDNSLDNRGLNNSFIDMGPGWAQAVSSPFRLYKSFTTLGGIKSPLLIKMPGDTDNQKVWNHSFVHVTDILPTFLEIAGSEYPGSVNGKAVSQPIGKSLIPLLTGTRETLHNDSGMGYELFEMKAFIQGEWKILRLPVPFGTGDWTLYNLASDPGEIHDLSDRHPKKKAELITAWQKYAKDNEVYDHKGRFDALYRKAYGVDD